MEIVNTFVFSIVRRRFILEALRTLKETTPPNYKTIVVDQTMPDTTFEAKLREACDLWIKTKYNYGFSQSMNIGLRIAPTPLVTAANDDIVFLKNPYKHGWFEGVLNTFMRYDTAIGVNMMSVREPGWGWGEPGYREYLTFEEAQDPENIRRLIEERNGQMIDGVTTFCTVFQRDKLEEIGLFDERFSAGGEDYDACARAYQAGYRVLSTSYAWCWHWWGQSKDESDGLDESLPRARPPWNKISTKGYPEEGLWHPDIDVWGKNCVRTDPMVARMPL